MRNQIPYLVLLLISLLPLSTTARRFVLVLSPEDLKDPPNSPADDPLSTSDETNSDWDEFGEADSKPDDELDPGSWRPIFEPDSDPFTKDPINSNEGDEEEMMLYYSGVRKMVRSVSEGEASFMEEAVVEIEAAAGGGYAHAQSALGFFYNMGMVRERDRGKGFMYHYFASEGGNMQSKMALAYAYSRQDVCTYLFIVFVCIRSAYTLDIGSNCLWIVGSFNSSLNYGEL